METRVEFVLRVADELRGTLSAGVALDRAEMLRDEAQRLEAWFQSAPPPSPYSKWRTYPFNIGTYFAVGYVTCMEWHARSRLADLFTFDPSAIKEDDLKKAGGLKAVASLVAKAASIPQYLAATGNFSSSDAYIAVFARLFAALKIPNQVSSVVREIGISGDLGRSDGLDALDSLFSERNILVHEINETHVGHPFHHDFWEFGRAAAYGEFVVTVIRQLEAAIIALAPKDFPHLLDNSFLAIDPDVELDRAIDELEAHLATRIEGFSEACEKSKDARAAEEQMLAESGLRLRWYDGRTAPRRALRVGRLKYLKSILDELGAGEEPAKASE